MKAPALVIIVAIVCITFLDGLAIWKGINGWYFSLTIGAILAAIGVSTKQILDLLRGGRNGKESDH